MTDTDTQKRKAAIEAAKLVESGMYVGLGTGSTVGHFLTALAARIEAESLQISCAATSQATERRARELGITVIDLQDRLDLAIDGADEIEFGSLRLIKGLGGALLREKIVAQSAHRFVVIADEGKLVRRLGEHVKLPVEITIFGAARTMARLEALGLQPAFRQAPDGSRFVTDNGNLIADCALPSGYDAAAIGAALNTLAGVVETGLFLEGCAAAFVGFADGSVRRFEGDDFARAGVAGDIATLRAMGIGSVRRKPLLAVMGVTASGKSTIGAMLAGCLAIPFVDGDDLHSAENRAKMHAGHPLDDNDRLPWLHRIGAQIRAWRQAGSGGVIVSSLLTRHYRDLVRGDFADLILIDLQGERDLLAARIAARHGHFMPSRLLDSQIALREPPGGDEAVISVDISMTPAAIVATVIDRLTALT
jgi:ribose 5-phosphate isomerase A